MFSVSQGKAVKAFTVPKLTLWCNHKALRTNQSVCGLCVSSSAQTGEGEAELFLPRGRSLSGEWSNARQLDFFFSDGFS